MKIDSFFLSLRDGNLLAQKKKEFLNRKERQEEKEIFCRIIYNRMIAGRVLWGGGGRGCCFVVGGYLGRGRGWTGRLLIMASTGESLVMRDSLLLR